MLTTNLKLLSTLTVAGVLSGCTAYSTAVNSLGPDRAVSDLQDLDKEYVLSSVSPLFCPAPEIYMVMPLENKGTLDVQLNNGEAYALEENYSAVSVSEQERKQFTGDQEQLMSLAGDAVEHLPPAPIYHTVYFELDTTTPTPESQKLIEGVYQQVADYPVPEVVVIGHTDTQASAAYNMTLSEARAKLIKDNLIAHGITPEMIRVEARGESDLLIPTADNVDEPRNRRVVINVR